MAVRASGGTILLVAAAAALAAVVVVLIGGPGGALDLEPDELAREAGALATSGEDPLAWDPERREELEERAASTAAHVIYAKSPGGVSASAERTASWRGQIEESAERHGVDADVLEAIVFLESAGRPDAIAGPTPESASGLAQIMPSTAIDLLAVPVDLDRSIRLTRRLGRAESPEQAERLRERRAEVDRRFDPESALDGAGRYLAIASERFGAEDLAVVSYHMGIGNLESVIRSYAGIGGSEPTGPLVAERDLSFARLYFDSAPDRNSEAHEILAGLGDESSEYLWKVRASQEIMRLHRDDPEELGRIARLATAKATMEEVFHPAEEADVFEAPGDIRGALEDGELAPLPDDPTLGWVPDARMGELAPDLGEPVELYRALRPEALATLSYMAATVRELSGVDVPLRVTSSVRDSSYQDLLRGSNPEATHGYSLHTTGWSFDVLREYANRRQAAAFQFALDRLRAHAVLDYAYEPNAIHVTVSEHGADLLPD